MILVTKEDIQLNEAAELLILPAVAFALIYPITVKLKQYQLLKLINSCYTNDYLYLEIKGKNIKLPPEIEKLYMLRKRELERILINKSIILVFNKDAYQTLRSAFQDIEFFKILSTGKSVEYTIDDFVNKYSSYFNTFGEFRKNANFEKMFTIFKRLDYSSLSQCAKINLFWIGMVLRQIVKNGKKYGIEKIKFTARKINQVAIEPT